MDYRQTLEAALTIIDLNRASKAGDDAAHQAMIAVIVAVATQGDVRAIREGNLIPVIEAAIPPHLLPGVIARIEGHHAR